MLPQREEESELGRGCRLSGKQEAESWVLCAQYGGVSLGAVPGDICGCHTGGAPGVEAVGLGMLLGPHGAPVPPSENGQPSVGRAQAGQPRPVAGGRRPGWWVWTPWETGVQVTMLMKLGLLSRPAMSKLPTPPVCGGEKNPGE